MNKLHFPVRGTLIYDELFPINFNLPEGSYHIATFFGTGLINAHDKAERQNWAGMFLDESVFEKVSMNKNIDKKCILYDIPFKNGRNSELAFRLGTNISEESFKNGSMHIDNNFKRNNKWDDVPSLKEKLCNTIEFLKFLIDK